MRHIHLADGLRLKFPGRNEQFDDGVEIGILAALMEFSPAEFTREISTDNLDQARALAVKLGYRLLEGPAEAGWTRVTLRLRASRPKLELVHSWAEG